MKTQKKVSISPAFSEKARMANAEKAKEKWQKKGWTVVNYIDGGMTGTSYLELEKEVAEKQKATTSKPKGGKFKKTMKGIAGFFIFIIILSWLVGENTEDSAQEKELVENQANSSQIQEKIIKYFVGDAEPKVKDAVWTQEDIFKVGVFDDGANRDGYAEYICQVLTNQYGLDGILVRVVDYAKVIKGEWVNLGTAHCKKPKSSTENTTKSEIKKPETQQTKTKKNGIKFTYEQFIARFNQSLKTLSPDTNLKVTKTVVAHGGGSVLIRINKKLAFNTFLDGKSKKIDMLMFSAIHSYKNKGDLLDAVFSSAATIMAIENPEMTKNERAKILKQLGMGENKRLKKGGSEISFIRKGVKYSVSMSSNSSNGIMLLVQF